SSVSAEQLSDVPVSSVAQVLTGRLAGVQITTAEGSPDAEVRIRVRGSGSITQDNSPLYIVDGFPADNINSIAPTDIQSIDVLKDASSTAIYGARGANGVVI
ncbi:MAG TPA: TonB-dependent receptor plug domain-containing protein, partial [Prolixibacteraceae bacterium]|nr:TonB-dependent receptor plug domain-containing protein [Prolixibacteraceae bacterium]